MQHTLIYFPNIYTHGIEKWKQVTFIIIIIFVV